MSGIVISSFSSLNFVDDESIPAYNESTPNLGVTGRLILDCFTGLCPKKNYYYDSDNDLRYEYVDKLDFSCSEQCSYNRKTECVCEDPNRNKGKCSRKYDDKYDNEKYCYADNVIYDWKGKRYKTVQKEVYTYYKNAKLKDEECPKGTINCGIIDDNENKLCISFNSSCPINYFSENKTDTIKNYSSIMIGNKTFYYSFDDNTKNERKIIAGLIADSDLLLNEKNNERVLIDTNKISEFLEDNKNLYKEVKLGFDPYKEEHIDKRGNSYLRYFFNDKVDLSRLRNNIETYNHSHLINEDIIKPINKKIILTGIFGFIAIGCIFIIIINLFAIKKKIKDFYPGMCFLFIIFIILSLVFGCINISKFNELKDKDSRDDNNLPRAVNSIIVILGFILLFYAIFLMIYNCYLREKCRNSCCNICNKKNKASYNDITIKNIVTKY